MVIGCSVVLVALWKADRKALRATAPFLLLAAGAIAAVCVSELASWLGAPREVRRALLFLVAASSAAFIAWVLVSTVRLTVEYFCRR